MSHQFYFQLLRNKGWKLTILRRHQKSNIVASIVYDPVPFIITKFFPAQVINVWSLLRLTQNSDRSFFTVSKKFLKLREYWFEDLLVQSLEVVPGHAGEVCKVLEGSFKGADFVLEQVDVTRSDGEVEPVWRHAGQAIVGQDQVLQLGQVVERVLSYNFDLVELKVNVVQVR